MYFDHFAVSLVVFVSCALATTCDFNGGFGIRVPGNCSGDVFDCSAKTSLANRCCPKGTYCVYENDNGFCCPTENGCAADVVNVPKCPSPGYKLWEFREYGIKDAWCCDDTFYGVAGFNDNGFAAVGCSPAGHSLPTTTSGGYLLYSATRALNPTSSCTTEVTSTTSASSALSTRTSTTTIRTSTPTPDPDTESKDSAPLSKGAIAGIAIGAVAGVALIAGGLWALFRHRRQHNAQTHSTQYAYAGNPVEKAYSQTTSPPLGTGATTTPGSVGASTFPAPAYTANEPQELEGHSSQIHEIGRS